MQISSAVSTKVHYYVSGDLQQANQASTQRECSLIMTEFWEYNTHAVRGTFHKCACMNGTTPAFGVLSFLMPTHYPSYVHFPLTS